MAAATTEWQRECSVCYIRGLENEFITCDGCGVMVYCGEECRLKDWNPGDVAPGRPCHQALCARMKWYAAREPELCDLPFTFAEETTDRAFHEDKTVDFLQRYGVYGLGLWRRESLLLQKTQTVNKCGYFTDKEEDKWVLKEERTLLASSPTTPPPSPSAPLCDWQQYYIFRGLPLHSPVAAVLSCPMTLYFILTTRLRNDEPELFRRLVTGETFVIHILGVEKEVEMKEAFLECARLLPRCQLHIIMVGKQLSKTGHNYQWQKDNLHLSVHRALYHDLLNLPAPHLAVGFNAGLPAYPTWPPTLTTLMKQGTPAYFTDQSEYSCDCVSEAISMLGIPGVSPVTVNPFRSPLRIITREQNMPWFSNAFLYKLVYDAGS